MKQISLALLSSLFFFSSAHAGFLLTPFAFHSQSGKIKGTVTSGTTTVDIDEKLKSATLYGGRIGWSFGRFAVGGIYQQGESETENQLDGTISKQDLKDYGPFIGFQLTRSIRLWGEYYLESSLTTDALTEPLKGTGYKGVLSYSIFGPLSLSLEYLVYDYNKTESAGITEIKSQAEYIGASIGFPFMF